MLNEIAPATSPAPSGLLIRSAQFNKLLKFIFYAFVGVTILSIFVPLNPRMPTSGLDPSWEMGMNEAVARHMSFGKEIVFTYGPYASVLTRVYDPATDLRMVLASLTLAACFGCALLFAGRGRKRFAVIALLVFLAVFGDPELLLNTYAFLLVLCVIEYWQGAQRRGANLTRWQWAAVIVMWSALGLLPVIKGSLLPVYFMSVAVSALVALYRFGYFEAFVLAAIPLVSAVLFWIAGGQAVGDLPAYLRGISWMTSGYTDAIATGWGALPAAAGYLLVGVFIALSALACYAIGRCARLAVRLRAYLAAFCAITLFISFKHGFLKPSGVGSSFAFLATVLFILAFVYLGKRIAWPLIIAVVLTAGTSAFSDNTLIQQVHARFGIGAAFSGHRKQRAILAFCVQRALPTYGRKFFVSGWDTYEHAFEGILLRARGEGQLENRFADAEAAIRSAYPVPTLTGTVDEYEEEQSPLLATPNRWDPRPVMLSYSAYTPELAEMNEQHLRGQNAPDWILFHLESMDFRLPTLDDGMSWPALVDNYSVSGKSSQFVLLHRNADLRRASSFRTIETGVHRTGETVDLPDGPGVFFAQVELKPTAAGKAALVLLNPPQLHIVLNLANGQTRSYRVVAKMMSTGFLLTPAVSNDAEFASLMMGTEASQRERVSSFSIEPAYGGSIFWSRTYEFTLKQYAR